MLLATMVMGCPFSTDYGVGQGGNFTTGAGATGAGGSAGGSSDGGMPCATTSECNDNEPCTLDTCSNGQCVHVADDSAIPIADSDPCTQDICANGKSVYLQLPVGTPCGPMGSPTTCDANGQCVGCADKSDCPSDTECTTYECDANKVCIVINLPVGTMLPDSVAGDCHKSVCDGVGNTVIAFEASDVPADDGNDCTLDVCDIASMMPVHPTKVSGSACASNGGKVCDGAGNCVKCVTNGDCTAGASPSCDLATHTCVSCSDNIQNGSETGIDCGGACPTLCIGTACTNDAQCKSAHCADGVCCDNGCTTTCKACNVPGNEGVCTTLSAGLQDIGVCTGTSVCDGTSGGASCDNLSGKRKNGDPCVANSDCFNSTCSAGLCRLPIGQPCSDDVQCRSLHCANNVCAACVNNSDCSTAECDIANSRCKAPNGTPCSVTSDCKSNSVCNSITTSLCGQFSGACNGDQDCSSYNCVNNSCIMCTTADGGTGQDPNCASSTCLNGGVCALPTGAYCVGSFDCASQSCSGFPKKCQ